MKLTPLGDMDFENENYRCGTLLLTSELQVLRASVEPDLGVNAFQVAKDGRSKTYGILSRVSSDLLRWEFEESFPVIGLYGYQKIEDS